MKLHLLFAALAIGFGSQAQSLSPTVQASGGGYSATAGASLSWTLGETFTETLSAGNAQLTQGMQQPQLVITALNEGPATASVSVFPNPTIGQVMFQFSDLPAEQIAITITDVSGKQVTAFEKNLGHTGKSFWLDLSGLPAGQYLIRLQNTENSFFSTYQLQKN